MEGIAVKLINMNDMIVEEEFTIDFYKLPLDDFDITDNKGESLRIFSPRQMRDLNPFIIEEKD